MVKTLFQASTWNALALGNFDTVISVRELLRCVVKSRSRWGAHFVKKLSF